MPRGFGRLPFLNRHGDRSARSDGLVPALAKPPLDADTAAIGPPMLLPAMIYREVLFDASEMMPVWARPRPPIASGAPQPVASGEGDAPPKRRARRPKPTGAAGSVGPAGPAGTAEPAEDKPRRPRKPRSSRS